MWEKIENKIEMNIEMNIVENDVADIEGKVNNDKMALSISLFSILFLD